MLDDEAAADVFVHAVVRDWRSAPLSESDKALCAFAAKLTLDQKNVGPEELETLRSQGFSDFAIHDAAQVIGYFNYITRIADALGVEAETFIPLWGGEQGN